MKYLKSVLLDHQATEIIYAVMYQLKQRLWDEVELTANDRIHSFEDHPFDQAILVMALEEITTKYNQTLPERTCLLAWYHPGSDQSQAYWKVYLPILQRCLAFPLTEFVPLH